MKTLLLVLLGTTLAACATPQSANEALRNFETTRPEPSH